MDKGHGRIEERALWVGETEPQTLGLAGAAQVFRIERKIDHLRGGQVVKHTQETVFGATTFLPEEAGPDRLLAIVRDHWKIENGQHHRRDRTQDEDRCTVRQSGTARVLSLFRSLAIFLHEAQRTQSGGKKSLPDFERHNARPPNGLIRRLVRVAP